MDNEYFKNSVDSDKLNNRLDNLQLITARENVSKDKTLYYLFSYF